MRDTRHAPAAAPRTRRTGTAAPSVFLTAAFVFAAAASTAAGQRAHRAIWLWEPDIYQMLDSPADAEAALDFIEERGIGTVYLYADEWEGRNAIRDEPEKYRALIAGMNARGLAAYALLGSAPLHTHEYVLDEKRDMAVAMFQRVLDYNASSEPHERFVGVNVDIEPYILEDWNEQRQHRAWQFLDLARVYMRMTEESGQELDVGPAIPFWFDGFEVELDGVSKPLSQHVQDIYDYVSLMDYRDRAEGGDGIIRHGSLEMDYAATIGKKVMIGVETMQTDPEKLTFHEEGTEALEAELALAEKAWAGRPEFGGFVIHHFRTYRALPAQGHGPAR